MTQARVNRYAEYLRAAGSNVRTISGVDWTEYHRFVVPAYLPHCVPQIESNVAVNAVRAFGSNFARWTSEFDDSTPRQWWYVIRDGSYSLRGCSSKTRNQINRGLKQFTARPIGYEELLSHGYDVCRKAVKRYGNERFLPDQLAFERRVTAASDFKDVVEYFGVFSATQLIGFSENYIQDGAVYWESIWLDPDFLSNYSSYALTHCMLDHYLNSCSARYVSDGSRSLYHETNVQEFFITKFGFRRAFARIAIEYSKPALLAVASVYPFRQVLSNVATYIQRPILRRACGVLEQEGIRRATVSEIAGEQANKYSQIAQLHIANLDQGFLSTLGIPFLSEIYRAIEECQQAVLIVRSEDGKVVGFLAGLTAPMSVIYRAMLRRLHHWGWYLIPVMLSPGGFRHILDIIEYGNNDLGINDLPAVELLSIAIAPDYRGTGIAETMYCQLLDYFKQKKISRFKILVGEALIPAHKFYLRMGAQARGVFEVHSGQQSTMYVQEVTQ
jgi:ribosomal protein S18 acetylase RimI-like enzyme